VEPEPGNDALEQQGGSGPAVSADRKALFSKYKHAVVQGVQQAETVRQQQQLVNQLKQELKVGCAVDVAGASSSCHHQLPVLHSGLQGGGPRQHIRLYNESRN
jgi:hypothetical protein